MPSSTPFDAAARTTLIDVVHYRVDLDLTAGADTFTARTTITFHATRPGASTFVDVAADRVHTAVLNGRALDVRTLDGHRLPVPGLAAQNELEIVAEMRFSRDGEGLHRVVDPVDGRVYLHAAGHAPRIFACFDQPDLRAPFTFTVAGQPDWQVFGSTVGTVDADGRWHLAETRPLPPHLTTLVVGPYVSDTREHAGVALALRCRPALAGTPGGDLDELFEVAGQCLDAFHRLFGVPYPFRGFDQVFAPELTVPSLDRPGGVLLRERYLPGPCDTDREREERTVAVARAMALAWLAGLVGAASCNDLWLSQALADYLAHRVPGEVTRFTSAPTTFAVHGKAHAVVADQRPSTRPVWVAGTDPQTALVSQVKGHAVLRQLVVRIGSAALRDGLRIYLTRHASGSATSADFLAALSEAAGVDLTGWAQVWLREAGVTALAGTLCTADGIITSAVIEQTAPDAHPLLRPHILDVGLYHTDGTAEVVRVPVAGARTPVPQLLGRRAPAVLLLNDGDLTYAKIRFDDRSAAALPDLLPRLSPLNRATVCCALLLGVWDGHQPAAAYLDLVAHMIAVEEHPSILTEVLAHARTPVLDRFLGRTDRPAAAHRLATAAAGRLAALPPGDERQRVLLRFLIGVTAEVSLVRALLAGRGLPAGHRYDADLRWRARYRLAVLGAQTEREIVDALAADPVAHADRHAARCLAARPEPAAKASAWAAITTAAGLSSHRLGALAGAFWQPEQDHLTEDYVERFFVDLPAAARLHGDSAVGLLVSRLYPHHAATGDTLRHAERLLSRPDTSAWLRRAVADATDDLARVVAVRRAGR